MALLLYKSDEMFSSTELIRKSKMIFDKVINDEIEKAIILRDGKPGFLLMDFKKYEDIMGEYEMLKEYVVELEKELKQKDKKKKIKSHKKETQTKETISNIDLTAAPEINIVVEENIIKEQAIEEIVVKRSPAMVVPPRPKATIQEQEIKEEDEALELDTSTHNLNPILSEDEKIEEKPKELSEDEELKQAFDSIKSMNFDDGMREIAEKKIRERILEARAEREKVLQDQIANEKNDLKKELELQVHIKEEKKKKEEELKEFWD